VPLGGVALEINGGSCARVDGGVVRCWGAWYGDGPAPAMKIYGGA
jgi:hypothetical protein